MNLPDFTDDEAIDELRKMANQQRRNAVQADRLKDMRPRLRGTHYHEHVAPEMRRCARLLDRMADYLAQRVG